MGALAPPQSRRAGIRLESLRRRSSSQGQSPAVAASIVLRQSLVRTVPLDFPDPADRLLPLHRAFPAVIGSEKIEEIATVAHSLSAKKRVRQNLRRRARNRARKDQIKEQVKTFNAALTAGDFTKAEAELSQVASRLDWVASKQTMHKNTASRKRSRLARKLNALRAAAAKGGGVRAAGAKASTA